VKCGANSLRAAESKIADFYFIARPRKENLLPPAIVICGTLQEWFPAFRIQFTRNSQVRS
jgi:hypothetical protein